MTRATPKALVREVEGGRYGTLAAGVTSDRLTLRPKGTRWNGPASYSLTWSQLYLWLADAKARQVIAERKAERKKARAAR